MRNFFAFFFMLLTLGAKEPTAPNDSVLKGKGGHLVPAEETDIELRREVLNMQLQGAAMHVDVHFEFFNPGDTTTLKVGFVTPPVSEGSRAIEDEGSPIEDFRAIVNGKEKDARVQKLGTSGFDSDLGTEWADFDFLHHFEVRFEPGLNVIEHSYRYGGRQGAMGSNSYPYRLTTAKNWGNEIIEEFTLNLDMGEGFFRVSPSFEKKAEASDWKMIGRGKLEKKEGSPSKMRCYTGKRAYISYQKEGLKPDQDLMIRHRAFFSTTKRLSPIMINQYPGNGDEKDELLKDMWRIVAGRSGSTEEKLKKLREYDASELRILRNLFFAMRGYDFNDETLQAYYEPYLWYIPDPDVKPELGILNPDEREWVKRIKALEEEKKEP